VQAHYAAGIRQAQYEIIKNNKNGNHSRNQKQVPPGRAQPKVGASKRGCKEIQIPKHLFFLSVLCVLCVKQVFASNFNSFIVANAELFYILRLTNAK